MENNETKKTKTSKIKSITNTEIISKTVNRNGFPKPLRSKCYECKKTFSIPFVPSQKNYSRKNILGYWIGEEEESSDKICNPCLKALYYDKPHCWKAVTDLKKHNILKGYIHHQFI